MDEREVDRIADLMHRTFCEYRATVEGVREPPVVAAFHELRERLKERYRVVARAVLADLYCLDDAS